MNCAKKGENIGEWIPLNRIKEEMGKGSKQKGGKKKPNRGRVLDPNTKFHDKNQKKHP